jgi:hypothetical protein
MRRQIISGLFGLVLAFGLTGCVSQSDYDELKAELEAVKAMATVETQTSADANNISSETSADVSLSTIIESNQTDSDINETTTASSPPKLSIFDESTVISQLAVKEYRYFNSYWNYAFLEIANNSEYDLRINVEATFYNANNEMIGVSEQEEEAVQSGATILLYFMPDEEYSKMEYEFDVEEEPYYKSLINNLTYESTPAKDKEIISVTNSGSETIDFVDCSVLFFNGADIVGFEWTYFVDDDSELKPGETERREMNCYDPYDSFNVYFSGRG